MRGHTSPIGIIDSGIGGFSVALRAQRLLPHENLLYFGDGGNMPYGNHSAEEILAMTRYMLRFMEEREVKILLVACNTISCLVDRFRAEMTCPVLSVIQAGADAAARLPGKKIGVVATCFTHTTGCYPELIGKLAPEKQVISRGCTKLAALVEHHLGDPAGREKLNADLRENLDELVYGEKIDCCVLGCTHYSLVEGNIEELYPKLPLVDPADQMVKTAEAELERQSLLNYRSERGTLEIYTTGSPEEYREKAEKAGLDPVTSVRSYPRLSL